MTGPSPSGRSYGYEMPPTLIHSLVYGTTWGLFCPECRRHIAVDVIRMVESVADVRDFDSGSMLRGAKCKDCGAKLKHTAGFKRTMRRRTSMLTFIIAMSMGS